MIPQICKAWLENAYPRTRRYQEGKGVRFDLTLEEYCKLWEPLLWKMEKALNDGTWHKQQKHPELGYVVGWRKKQFRAEGVMNADTARVQTRKQSVRTHQMQAGEKHSELSKQKISAAKKGEKRSPEARAKYSAAKQGTRQTPEQIAKRVEATRRTKALNAAALAQQKERADINSLAISAKEMTNARNTPPISVPVEPRDDQKQKPLLRNVLGKIKVLLSDPYGNQQRAVRNSLYSSRHQPVLESTRHPGKRWLPNPNNRIV